MPTALPSRPAPEGRVPRFDVSRLLILVARVRCLDLRLNALHWRAELRGRQPDGYALLRLARRWLAVHARIAALLPGLPEHVAQVRALLRVPADPQKSLAETR